MPETPKVLGLIFEDNTLFIFGPMTEEELVKTGKQYDEILTLEARFNPKSGGLNGLEVLKSYPDGWGGMIQPIGLLFNPTLYTDRARWTSRVPLDTAGQPNYNVVWKT